jgi:hypothetical protein
MFASLLAASLGSSLGLCGALIDAVMLVGLAMPSGSSPSSCLGVGWTMTDWVIIEPFPWICVGPPGDPMGREGQLARVVWVAP